VGRVGVPCHPGRYYCAHVCVRVCVWLGCDSEMRRRPTELTSLFSPTPLSEPACSSRLATSSLHQRACGFPTSPLRDSFWLLCLRFPPLWYPTAVPRASQMRHLHLSRLWRAPRSPLHFPPLSSACPCCSLALAVVSLCSHPPARPIW
jgi:hypothetical protein